MYLAELKLWNFRKYGGSSIDLALPHLCIPFNKGLNILIGENDSGKTAIIDAVKLVLKTHAYEWIKTEHEDFHQNESRLRIELSIKGFSPSEAKNFTEWLTMEGSGTTAQPVLKLIYQAERRDGKILPADVKAGSDDSGFLLHAEAREYLKITYLKALRDAPNDLIAKKSSRLSQILQEHFLFKKKDISEKHDFELAFMKVNDEIEKWFDGHGKKEHIKDKMDSFLERFISRLFKSNLSLGEPQIRNILEKITLSIAQEKNLGLGTLNRLYMAVELLHLKKDWDGLKLCLIEEQEAHLHPQAQMKVIKALQSEDEVQFILSTHSPNLASKVPLHNIILLKDGNAYPLGENPVDKDPKSKEDRYTKLSTDDYQYLERFLDVTKANLFFAKGVIVVEGWSEEILIPALASKLGYNLTQNEVSLVNVGSTAYLRFAKIFLRNDGKILSTPVAIVTDLDNRPAVTGDFDDVVTKIKAEAINALVTSFKDTAVEIFIAKDWTLEWCLYKSATLSNLFIESVREVHSKTDEFKEGKFEEAKFIAKLRKDKGQTPLDKVEIAYRFAIKLEKDVDLKIADIEKDEYLDYLIKSIKHVCDESEN